MNRKTFGPIILWLGSDVYEVWIYLDLLVMIDGDPLPDIVSMDALGLMADLRNKVASLISRRSGSHGTWETRTM